MALGIIRAIGGNPTVRKVATTTSRFMYKHGPKIMVGLGIGCFGVAVVECGKSTTKLKETSEPHKEKLDEYRLTGAANEDVVAEYISYGIDIGKLYLKPVLYFVAGTGLTIGGFRIISARVGRLAAENAVLLAENERLSNHIEEKEGSEVLSQVKNNSHFEFIQTEDGEVEVEVLDELPTGTSAIWKRGMAYWDKAMMYNFDHVNRIESIYRDKLWARHSPAYVLNEIYDNFGIDRSPIRAIAGIDYDENDPNAVNVVNLRPRLVYMRDEVGNLEECILLDPVCKSNIIDKFGGA